MKTPSGLCVNTDTDIDNCGSIGYECPGNDRSCTAGICSTTPVVQLTDRVVIPGWNSSRKIDDEMCTISLPFNITMYNYSTSIVLVSNNGVSDSCTKQKNRTIAKLKSPRKPGYMFSSSISARSDFSERIHTMRDQHAPACT